MDEFENLARRFILTDELRQEDLKEMVNRVLNLAVVDTQGYVRMQPNVKKNLNQKEQVLLALLARYLASELGGHTSETPRVSAPVAVSEVAGIIGVEARVVSARLGELEGDGFSRKTKRGVYKMEPHRAEAALRLLEEKVNDR